MVTFLTGGSLIGILQYSLQRKTDKESNELKALELQVNITDKEREHSDRIKKESELKDGTISELRSELWETKRTLAKMERDNDSKIEIIEEQRVHIERLEAIIDKFERETNKLMGEYDNGTDIE